MSHQNKHGSPVVSVIRFFFKDVIGRVVFTVQYIFNQTPSFNQQKIIQ
jgi:hypothetical protein